MGSFIFLIPSLLDRKHSIYFRFQKLFLSFTTFKIVHIRSGDWKLLELSTKFREVVSDCGDAAGEGGAAADPDGVRAAGAGPEHGAAGGQHQVRPQAPRQVTLTPLCPYCNLPFKVPFLSLPSFVNV